MTDTKTQDQSDDETQEDQTNKLRRSLLKMNFYRNQGNKFEALAKRLAEELATAREDIQAMEQAQEEQEQIQQERLTETKRQLAKAREDIQALEQAKEQEQIQQEQKTQAVEDAAASVAALKKKLEKNKKIFRELTKATNNNAKNVMVLRAMAEGLIVKYPDDEVGQSKANEAWRCYETMNTFPVNLTTYPKTFADYIDLMKEGLTQTIQTVVDRTIETGRTLVATMQPGQAPMAFVEALKHYAEAKGLPTASNQTQCKLLFVFICSFSISLTTKPWQPMCVTFAFFNVSTKNLSVSQSKW
jgi:hypothetical protein|tara:strand:+ start:250 stop:1152 length:903 start_codon:yes stop_codon:yes gene_type:complete